MQRAMSLRPSELCSKTPSKRKGAYLVQVDCGCGSVAECLLSLVKGPESDAQLHQKTKQNKKKHLSFFPENVEVLFS